VVEGHVAAARQGRGNLDCGSLSARGSLRRVTADVRPERPEDRESVRRVIAAAFGQEDPAHGDDVADIWEGLGAHRRTGLVAEQSGAVVGHVGLSRAWLDARRELVDVWVLSPLSVLPDQQHAGLGTALVAAAVETARASGIPALFLEGSPIFYGARGFEPADRYGILPPALERTPRAAFQVVVFESHKSWMTGQLIYPDVWWEHGAAGLRDPRLAELEGRLADLH
jgi:putative acetyltransferase